MCSLYVHSLNTWNTWRVIKLFGINPASLPPTHPPSLPPSHPPTHPPSLPPSLLPSLPPSLPASLPPSLLPSLLPSFPPSLPPCLTKVDTLHLNDMALDNEDVQNVAAAAAKHPTLTHVNLSNNPKVSLMSARAVLGLVAENPNIRRLELHGTHVGEDVMKKIEEQLQQNAARQTAAS